MSRLTNIQIWAGLPAIFCYGQYDLYKRWLACMRITFVPMVAMCIATCMHLPFCLLFMNAFGLGIVGLAVASSCRDFILLVALMIYGNCKTEIRDTLQPFWSRETFRGWGEYLKVSLPSTVMICAEWWGFQVLTIVAGTMGVVEQASFTMLTTIGAILFMAPLGIQEATCAIIGNCIGANNVPLAKRFFRLICKVNLAVVISLSLLVATARHQIVAFYTNDEAVRQIVSQVLIVLAVNFTSDGMQSFLQGPVRAMGLQKIASFMSLGCYYVIGIPSSLLLGLTADLGVLGLEAGFGIAATV